VAEVTVHLVGNDVLITVTNSPAVHAGADSGTGRGLAGIRERLAPLSGRVEWGPLADGGFQVQAVLPAALEGAAS
jgi:signal transduction histidine kinase